LQPNFSARSGSCSAVAERRYWRRSFLRPAGFAPIPIGLALTLIHLITIPVTNTSVNPARSIGPALFAGGPYIAQLWLFIIAPLIGAVAAGLVARALHPENR
jgi:aquaporin Z